MEETEVVPCESRVIEIAVHVEKERIAAPTEKETVIAGLRHQGFPPDGNWGLLDDNFAILTHAIGSYALKTADCRSLLPIFGRCELDAVTNIGNDITVGIDLELVQCSWREGLFGRWLQRLQGERRVHIKDDC